MSCGKKGTDPGPALDSKKLGSGTEELISVDPENALTDEEFNTWLREHKGNLRRMYWISQSAERTMVKGKDREDKLAEEAGHSVRFLRFAGDRYSVMDFL